MIIDEAIVGVSETIVVRNKTSLTTGYVASATVLEIDNINQVVLLTDFTIGSSAGCQIKVEFSADESSWYQESITEPSGDNLVHSPLVHIIDQTSTPVISFPVAHPYARISVMAINDASSASLGIDATLSFI